MKEAIVDGHHLPGEGKPGARESITEPPLRKVTLERECDQLVRERRHPFEPEMVFVPAGSFWIGTDRRRLEAAGVEWNKWFETELPQHQVALPDYWSGRFPVTNAEYRAFIKDGGYRTRAYWTEAGWRWKGDRMQPRLWNDERYNGPQQPVVGVSWYEAVAYCRWLSSRTGREYRLPRETEWEKAARGADGRIWPWGDEWGPDKCNTQEKGPRGPTPVGSYSPQGDSPYGCADMAGNVWEWCATKWESSYENYRGNDDLEGGVARVVRGGALHRYQSRARCSSRLRNHPGISYSDLGFRCVSPVSGSDF